LDALFICGHSELVCIVMGVANGEVNASIRPIFENAENDALERAAKEHLEWCILYDVGVNFKGDVANL
jgi:hypothetical protein